MRKYFKYGIGEYVEVFYGCNTDDSWRLARILGTSPSGFYWCKVRDEADKDKKLYDVDGMRTPKGKN